jgi:hypothetical protein
MKKEIISGIAGRFARIYELIDGCDEVIATLRKMGETESSPLVRQEFHLRKQYVNDLNEMLKEIHLEVSDTLLKAA